MAQERWIGPEPGPTPPNNQESLGDLLKDLATESSELIRNEKDLAKLEIKETVSEITQDGVRLAIGIGLAAVGGLALTAFLILVVGNLLNGSYWAGALIVGALFLIVGGLMARSAVNEMKKTDIAPDETIHSLKQDARWLKREADDFRRDMTT